MTLIAAPPAPSVVYLLADHLDAVLARGEDLLATAWRPDRLGRCAASIAENQTSQRRTVDEIRTQEMVLLARALKARERARELAALDGRFAPLARMFTAATASLEDAALEVGDVTPEDFETGDGTLAYLRSRGLMAADTAMLDDCGAIAVTPAFKIARRIEIVPLLDLVATFLDALEVHYDLYPEAVETGEQGVAPAGEPNGTAAPAETAN